MLNQSFDNEEASSPLTPSPHTEETTFDHSSRLPSSPIDLSAVLKPCADSEHVIELVHAGTLFSPDTFEQGEVSEAIKEYFREAAESGITTLYIVGMYEPGDFSKLIMPYFAQEWSKVPPAHHIGPSVFSVLDYTPRETLSSWSNVSKIIEAAAEEGITPVFDFIPNTIAVDSLVSMNKPDYIRDYPHADRSLDDIKHSIETCKQNGQCTYQQNSTHDLSGVASLQEVHVYQDGPDSEIMHFSRENTQGTFSVYLQRSLQSGFKPYGYIVHEKSDGSETVHCKQLGTDGFIHWADVFMLNTDSPDVIAWQSEIIAHLSTLVPALRADMAHLPNPQYWSDIQDNVTQQGVTSAEIWGEAYGSHAHQALADNNVHSYANYLREWLTENPMNVSALMHQLFQDPSGADFYKRGMSLAYTANHDDAMGTLLPKEAAAMAILTALPVTKVMMAQGQRHGDTHRYGADQHVPLDEYYTAIAEARRKDPGYAEFMDRLVPLMGARVFRSPDSHFRPAKIETLQHRDANQLFHIVRECDNEKVLAVIQAEEAKKDSLVRVNLYDAFSLNAASAQDYLLLDLITGEVQDVQETLDIGSNDNLPGYDVSFFTIVPRQ